MRAETNVEGPSGVKVRWCSGNCTSKSRWPVTSCFCDSNRKNFPSMLLRESVSNGLIKRRGESRGSRADNGLLPTRSLERRAGPPEPTSKRVALAIPVDNASLAVAHSVRSRYGSDVGRAHEDRACEPSCRAPTTRMRRSRWWMRYSNRHPPSVSSASAECASLQNALVGEMPSMLAAISSKTSNARKSKSAGASISAAK